MIAAPRPGVHEISTIGAPQVAARVQTLRDGGAECWTDDSLAPGHPALSLVAAGVLSALSPGLLRQRLPGQWQSADS